MLLLLPGTGATAHSDVLQGSAERGKIVTFEMVQRDEHICIHHRTANLGLLHKLTSGNRNEDLVSALQAVTNDDGTAAAERIESVLPSTIEVVDGILSMAGIHCGAIGQKRLAATFLDHIDHSLGILGSEVGKIAVLTEMYLYGDKLAVHIELVDSCGPYEGLELFSWAVTILPGMEIGKEHLTFH